jgi:hypothetical protein
MLLRPGERLFGSFDPANPPEPMAIDVNEPVQPVQIAVMAAQCK